MYKLIIVDDEDIILDNMSYIVEWGKFGFELVKTFEDGSEAYEYILAGNKVDLIFTDIKMTFMSGLDLAQKLHVEAPDTLVVILTAYQDFTFMQKAIRYNVFDYITKPSAYSDITEVLEKAKKRLDTKKIAEEVDGTSELDNEYISLIDLAKEYIEEHIADRISLNDVAGYINVNPEYLSKLFKSKTGEKYIDYVAKRKIEKAKLLLNNPTFRVSEVSAAVGYKSMHHFLKVFEKYTKTTPTKYRARMELNKIETEKEKKQ